MDGRRDGSGHPRWSASRSGAGPPSEKPVSSYASLACGPPPSYARQERQGSSGASWDYDDKPVRAASPVGRGSGAPYHSGGGAGRYSSDRGGGRGRGMHGGGRERNDRIERFSSSGQHRNSPERFQSGYESGEILPSQRAGTSQGPNQRRLDDLPFEGRDSRSGGNSSGRFTYRGGGGRDVGGRTGRFSGRFVDRGGGGRGGRADFRSRRGSDNRDYYTGRSSPEDSSRNDDGPRYLPGDKRSEPIHQRGDDRIMQQSRSYPGPRYSSLASNNPPDPRAEDCYIKRRRDEDDYPIDFEEKRSRNGDYVSRGRPAPNEEGGRFTQGALSLRASDEPPGDFDLRQLSRPGGDMRDRRGLDSNRAQLDRPPIRSSDVAVPPEEQRSRLMIDPIHKGGVRSRPGNINEGSYDDRIRRSVNEELRLDRLDRGDARHRGEVNSRRFVPARDDPRGVSGPPPSNLREEPPLSRYVADSRIPLDASRPRDPRDTHIPRPQQRFDDRVPDRYNDSGVSTDNRSVDNRPPPVSSNALERNRDPRSGADFRSGRQTEIDHVGDSRPTRGGGMVGRSDDPRNGNSGDGWPLQHSSSQHVYDPPPNRTTNWNSSQSNDRSPIPSPRTVRGTMPPPSSLDSIISDPGSMVPGPLPFAGKGGGSIPDGRDYLSGREGRGGRGGGGGRGFGFRGGGGRGGGRSEFGGGRYSSMGDGGREESNYSLGPKPPGMDQPFHSKGPFKRYPGGDARPATEDSIPPEFGIKVKKSEKPPVKLEKSGNGINSGSSDTIQNRGVGGSLGGMQMKSGDSSSPPSSSAVASPAVDNSRIDEKNEKKPRPISPPPKGEPSGIMKALVRLLDLEASMEYAYAKHMQLVKKQQELKAQAVILKDLPVGLDAFKEDLDALEATASMYDIE